MGLLTRWRERGDRARRIACADALLLDGDTPAAIDELERVVADHPEDHGTVRRLVELHAEAGHVADVVSHMTTLLDWDLRTFDVLRTAIFDTVRDKPELANLYRSAVDRLRVRVEDDPDDTESRFRLAEAYEALNDATAADAVYGDLSEREDPAVQTRSLYAQARLAAASGDAAVAARCLNRLMTLAPEQIEAFEADAEFDAIRATEEIADVKRLAFTHRVDELRRHIEQDSGNAHPRRQLIQLYTAHGDPDAAVVTAREGVDRFPNDTGMSELLADALFESGDHDAAMDAYLDLLRIEPRHAWALYRTGLIHERRDELPAAVGAYRDALGSVHEDTGLALRLASAFARVNDVGSSLTALEAAVQLSTHLGGVSPSRLLTRIEDDPDLDAIRDDPAYRAVVDELASASDEAVDSDV